MGCGTVKPKIEPLVVFHPEERRASESQSNLLLRYQTLENVYKIKLVPPKTGM